MADFLCGGLRGIRPASVNDHIRPFRGQQTSDGEADAFGGTGDERSFIFELKIHTRDKIQGTARDAQDGWLSAAAVWRIQAI